jgi:hypothetical protein
MVAPKAIEQAIHSVTDGKSLIRELFPGSQTPVWKPPSANLCFASRAAVRTRNRVSRKRVPEQSSGTRRIVLTPFTRP